MLIEVFLKGVLIGLLAAVPLGPIGTLCIQRTLRRGSVYGIISGLGAATIDALYGSVAAFGLTWISAFLIKHQFWIRLIGGGILGYLGIKAFFSKSVRQSVVQNTFDYIGAYSTTLGLTSTNPMTIFSFTAIFAGFRVLEPGHYSAASFLVSGVFIGSELWWIILCGATSLFQEKIGDHTLSLVNKGSGLLTIIFSIVVIVSALIH